MLREFDLNNISLKSTLSEIMKDENLGNKSKLRFDEMFSHQSALIPWIPFYKETLDSITDKQLNKYYSKNKTKSFSVQISDDLFINNSWNDTIYKRLIDSDLLEKKTYRYSDVPFYFIKNI